MKSDGEFYCKSWDACSGRVKAKKEEAKAKVSLTINGEEPPTTTSTIDAGITVTTLTSSEPITTARSTWMTRAAVLSAAENAVNGSRDQDYGSPEDSFRKIADLWNAYLGHVHPDDPDRLESWDVALMMDLLKTARLAAKPGHRDSWVDKAGYAACGAEAWANRQW